MNIIKKIIYGACIIMTCWLVISYVDVVIFNLDGGVSSHWWNMFNL